MRGQFPLAGETQAVFVEKAASVMSCEGREGFRRAALERGFWEERKCREVKQCEAWEGSQVHDDLTGKQKRRKVRSSYQMA